MHPQTYLGLLTLQRQLSECEIRIRFTCRSTQARLHRMLQETRASMKLRHFWRVLHLGCTCRPVDQSGSVTWSSAGWWQKLSTYIQSTPIWMWGFGSGSIGLLGFDLLGLAGYTAWGYIRILSAGSQVLRSIVVQHGCRICVIYVAVEPNCFDWKTSWLGAEALVTAPSTESFRSNAPHTSSEKNALTLSKSRSLLTFLTVLKIAELLGFAPMFVIVNPSAFQAQLSLLLGPDECCQAEWTLSHDGTKIPIVHTIQWCSLMAGTDSWSPNKICMSLVVSELW